MEPELEGQGAINKDRTERVGVHLVKSEQVIEELNGMISTDQTGRFPTISQRGNKYIMVLYNYDSNAILATGTKGRKGTELIESYEILYKRLVSAGIKPVLQRLDNEASDGLISAIKKNDLKYQLAAPYLHRLNPAERAIQSFKNHLISNLHGCDKQFPAYQWCRIIEQCEMTLNMLRRSRINPKLSAYTQLFGVFDYNATPLAPIGTKAFIHERPNQRSTFADHGKIAFVIGPAMEHYRELTFYVPSTRGIRNTDTYVFLPTKFELPANAAADRATAALEDFTSAIKQPKTKQIPFKTASINKAIDALTALLSPKRATTKNTVASPRVGTMHAPRPRVNTRQE